MSLIQRAQRPTPQPRSADGDADGDAVEARDDPGERAAVLGGTATGSEQAPRPKEGVAEICESKEEKEGIEEDDDEDEVVDTKEDEGDDERDEDGSDDDDDGDQCKRAYGRGLAGHDRVGGVSGGDDPINGSRERGGDRVAEALLRSVRCERAHEAMLRHTDRGEWARRTP